MILPDNIVPTINILKNLSDFFKENTYSIVGVLVDENTRACCYPVIEKALPRHQLIEIKSGEEEKNLDTCQMIWGALTDLSFDRKSLIVNLGGGVIGDMGGFCATTYKRGIDFIN